MQDPYYDKTYEMIEVTYTAPGKWNVETKAFSDPETRTEILNKGAAVERVRSLLDGWADRRTFRSHIELRNVNVRETRSVVVEDAQ